MKSPSRKCSILITTVLLLTSVSGFCDSLNEIQRSLIAQIAALKPANVEANAAIVEGFIDGAGKRENLTSISGKIEVTGYATNTDLAIYLKAVTDSNIGAVDVKDINPTNHNGRRLSHFGFQVSVSMPENCKENFGILAGDDLVFSRRACGSISFALLSHVIFRDEKGKPTLGIIDFVKLPSLKNDDAFREVDCSYKLKKPQGDTFALIAITGPYIKSKEDFYKTKVSYAIRPNLKTQKLDILNPSTVTCDYKDDHEDRD